MKSNDEFPHRRFNPLKGEWVLVSPQRENRPWLGQMEKMPSVNLPIYDPKCYLCPGNSRADGARNPIYTSTYVFDNDFPALFTPAASNLNKNQYGGSNSSAPDSIPGKPEQNEVGGILHAESVYGVCRVVCFSPRHDLTLPELVQEEIEAIINTWKVQSFDLGQLPEISYIQVFENKGEMMGCSNPHPHSQIWATSYIPDEPAKELISLSTYRDVSNSCLLCDYLSIELEKKVRIVASNQDFTALIPYWAVWPYEILLIANRHIGALNDLGTSEISSLADMLKRVTTRYDNLFEISFPYSMGFHQTPSDGLLHEESHLHSHFFPPLLRSASVRKFMVGFEMLAMPQRDLTPEIAAEKLQALEEHHYKQRL